MRNLRESTPRPVDALTSHVRLAKLGYARRLGLSPTLLPRHLASADLASAADFKMMMCSNIEHAAKVGKPCGGSRPRRRVCRHWPWLCSFAWHICAGTWVEYSLRSSA